MEREMFMSKRILETLPKIKCGKCGKPSAHVTMKLMMGARGYRQYPVCDTCLAGVQQKKQQTPNKPV